MAEKRQILSLILLKHAVAMVTDFQHKSSTLQCSGEHCQCVQYISSSCYVKWRNRRFLDTIVQYYANTLGSQLKIVFIIISWFLNTEITRSHSWSFVVTRGHSWLLVVTRGHSWSLVVIRGHSWSLVCTFRQDPCSLVNFSFVPLFPTKISSLFPFQTMSCSLFPGNRCETLTSWIFLTVNSDTKQ
jgi:hypothetical protein